jgi:ribose transport system substrate-binding protein
MNVLGSTRTRHRRRLGRTVTAGMTTAAALLVSFAGVSGASVAHKAAPAAAKGDLTAAQVATLTSTLAKATKPSRFIAAGPAFSAKSLKGKVLFFAQDSTANNQFGASFLGGVENAAAAAGLVFQQGNGDGSIAQTDAIIENAVNQKVGVILTSDILDSTIGPGLEAAKAAGIPVIESFIGDPHAPTAQEKSFGIFADATYCYSCTGKLAADYEILKKGGKFDSIVQQTPGSPPSDAAALGWTESVKEYCPKTCKISDDNFTLGSNYIQQFQSGDQVAAQNPAVNVMWDVYDFQMGYALPELQAAGASSRIDLLSENADLAQMQEMDQGTSVKVDVGNPVAWDGWAAVDEALRALKGLKAVANEDTPVRLFDVANVKTIDLSLNPADWYGSATYGNDYEKLWGVKS